MKEVLRSVGIDVGTTTTQLVFSDITIEDLSSGFTVPRVEIVAKDIVHLGDIHITPLRSATEIDAAALRALVEEDYQFAGMSPQDIQTGAVVITGETARKSNADEVLLALSDLAGEFVVATAGPTLESILAGRGAGADVFSKDHGAAVANYDIGGGTSNFVLFDQGNPITSSCLDVGGRLVRLDTARGVITYVAEKVAELCAVTGIKLAVGDRIDPLALRRLADQLCQLLEMSLQLVPKSEFYPRILTEPGKDLVLPKPIEYLMLSGGVADCVATPPEDPFAYGDLGGLLGAAIRESEPFRRLRQIPAAQTIRATVVGAGTHTTSLSGSTIEYDSALLPMKNVPALKLTPAEESSPETLSRAITERAPWFATDGEPHPLAIAFVGPRSPTFAEVQDLAGAIAHATAPAAAKGVPTIVVTESDLAKVLGQSLRAVSTTPAGVICVDSVHVSAGDYIDIGAPVAGGTTLPVVVKTLVFS